MKRIAITLLVLAVFILAGAGSAWGFATMGSDKTQAACLSCHSPAAKPAAPAPAAKPASPAPVAPAGKFTLKNQDITLQGVTKKVPVAVSGSTTLIQVRALADMLGSKLAWDNSAKVATFKVGTIEVAIQANQNKAVVNGKEIPVATTIQKGRLYAGLDALTEALGGSVKGSKVLLGEAGYVGSDSCKTCHAAKFEGWAGTGHPLMLRDAQADPKVIIGDFSVKGQPFEVETVKALGLTSPADIKYVIGGKWKQRYLVDVDGVLRVLPKQWVPATKSWTNYNYDTWAVKPYIDACVGCHSVGFSPVTKQYVEGGVGCESCHGPGANHLAKPSKDTIVNPAKLSFDRGMDTCNACHARGGNIDGKREDALGYKPGDDLSKYYKPLKPVFGDPKSGQFHPDGAGKMHRMQGQDYSQSLHFQAGITCWTCHDLHKPGMLTKPVDELCTSCHTTMAKPVDINKYMPYRANSALNYDIRTHTFKPLTAQWSTSKHAKPVDSPFRDGCVSCHDGVAYAKGITLTKDLPAGKISPIDCQTCHEGFDKLRQGKGSMYDGKLVVNGGKGNLCLDCHNPRRFIDPAAARKSYPHYGTQGAMLLGVGGAENVAPGKVWGSSPHGANPDTCVSCHFAVGKDGNANHYFKMPKELAAAACSSCHAGLNTYNRIALGDYDGNGKIEGIQTEVYNLTKLVEKAILAALDGGKGGTIETAGGAFIFKDLSGNDISARVSPELYSAAWNWKFVKNDKSNGIHNPIYAVQLLQQSYKLVTGKDVPGARIR